ncbi:hypothetical protein ACHQM5_008068 [Ranunculus cassubicifolius]
MAFASKGAYNNTYFPNEKPYKAIIKNPKRGRSNKPKPILPKVDGCVQDASEVRMVQFGAALKPNPPFDVAIVHKVLGDVKQAETIPPVQSAKKPAQAKEAAKPKAKTEVKKEEPAKPKAVELQEEEEAPKPKAKNPLDLLPPSKMVLDDWKRLYSNTKSNFREVAIKGFWDMYDPEGYSLWFCDYKYNDENTVSFVTLNKVGGFLQRMDLARKYAFGKMLIIGNEPPYKVKGLWLFRGQEIPKFVMEECYDMELYEWTKVDISDEAQKERASQMIEDYEPFEGEALLDAKCFK